MSAQTQKNERLPLDVILNLNYFCYWDQSRFYDEYLRNCTFSKAQFKQMMRHDPCHVYHYRELILLLPKIELQIAQERPGRPIPILVDQAHVDDVNTFQELANHG